MPAMFEDLVRMDLQALAAWLRSDRETERLSQQESRGLLEAFVSRLVDEAEDVDSDEWDRLADALDGAMASAGLDLTERAIRRLNLMCALVMAIGPSSEHALRNPNTAADLFLSALPMAFAEASALVVNWQRESLEDVRRLRVIKNLLTPLVGVEDLISDGAGKKAVREWMTLLELLP